MSATPHHYMPQITVIKCDAEGQETWRYTGEVLRQAPGYVLLEAYFDRDDRIYHGMPLRRGDRFVELYFTGRWYNVYEIRAREDGSLRGWYCNVSLPARLEGETLYYTDLALDLLVFPDGRQVVLDEDEFAVLQLEPGERQRAQAALAELQALFHQPDAGWLEKNLPV